MTYLRKVCFLIDKNKTSIVFFLSACLFSTDHLTAEPKTADDKNVNNFHNLINGAQPVSSNLEVHSTQKHWTSSVEMIAFLNSSINKRRQNKGSRGYFKFDFLEHMEKKEKILLLLVIQIISSFVLSLMLNKLYIIYILYRRFASRK